MRHAKKGKKFHRERGQRAAFIRNLANDLIRRERITTTVARAKAIRPEVERLVSFAKKQSLASRRVILSRVHNKRIAEKLYRDIGPRYQDRNGGYLRITKQMKSRIRDGAPTAVIEFV